MSDYRSGWAIAGVAVMLLLGAAFAAMVWQIATRPDIPELVESWTIEPVEPSVVWGDGDGVLLLGDFACVPGYDPDAAVQFQAAMSLEQGGTVPFFAGAKVSAGVVCDNGPTEFIVRWDNMPPAFVLNQDDIAFMRYSASPDGHVAVSIQSDTFIILTP